MIQGFELFKSSKSIGSHSTVGQCFNLLPCCVSIKVSMNNSVGILERTDVNESCPTQ